MHHHSHSKTKLSIFLGCRVNGLGGVRRRGGVVVVDHIYIEYVGHVLQWVKSFKCVTCGSHPWYSRAREHGCQVRFRSDVSRHVHEQGLLQKATTPCNPLQE